MPIINFPSLDAVPEELREFAKAEGAEGTITVNVVPSDKLKEFRENNVALAKERDELKAQNSRYMGLVGEDLSQFEKQYGDMKEITRRVKDGELTESTDIEEELAKRTSTMVNGYEEELKKFRAEVQLWKEKTSQKDGELKKNVVERAVTDAVLDPKSGARPDALEDILRRAHMLFRVEEGKVLAKNGDTTIYGSDGTHPMSPNEWLNNLKSEASYLFKDSSGGGAAGGKKDLQGGLTAEEFAKMTPQQKLDYANTHRQ